jgi:ABC-type Fe3+ transport system permease subunit
VVVATVLWLVFAVLVWNVIFDRVIVLAGRRYSHDAAVLYRTSGQYLHIDDVMQPAIAHGVRVASAAAVAVAVVALLLIRLANSHEDTKDTKFMGPSKREER